jgi:large subunit ribosomal protein L22
MAETAAPVPAPAPPAAAEPRRFHAAIRYARISPRKARYVTELLKGRSVNRAKQILAFSDKRGATFVNKLLDAVLANVTHLQQEKDLDIDVNRLAIDRIYVDPAPMWKRITAAPMGRALPIKKRNSHIHIVVTEGAAESAGADRGKRVRASRAAAAASATPPAPEPKE